MTFYPGGGRPKGSISAKTREVQAFAKRVCEDPEYRESILQRARTNNLGAMEATIWAYAYGRPKERLEIAVTQDLSALSAEELLSHADEIRQELLEAAALEAAIPAEFRVEPSSQDEDEK